MLRINPLARQRLADGPLMDLLEQATAFERVAAGLAAAASDDLYRLIPATEGALRGRLLALRRDIHNDRGQPGWPDHRAFEMPASVDRWRENQHCRQACQTEIRRTHEGALARERSMLRRRLGEGNYLTTLAQSASGVYAAACRYRDHEQADAKDRKAERALVQYLTRAMVRTSPYGRFTAVALAQPDPAGVAMDQATPGTATSEAAVDRTLFDYVMGGLAAEEGDPLVTLPPTARVDDERITFFQIGTDALRRLSAPLNRPTRLLVEILDLGPWRRSALAAALAQGLGVEHGAADRLVGIALGLGLLVTAWRGDRFVAQPVDQALRDLAPSGAEPEPALEQLRQFRSGLDRLGHAGPAERVALGRHLEAVGDELSRLARRPAKLTVNEDFVLDPLLVDPSAHNAALDDLAAVTEMMWAFDRMHTLRALVAAELVARFGAGCRVPLVEHAEALVRATYRAERILTEQPEAALGPADGSLAILAKVRREALTALRQGGTATDEVCWSPDDVTGLVAGVPDRFRTDPASYGLVVQPHGRDLIVNDTYAGHGPILSRFLHADQVRGGDAVARLRIRLTELYGPHVRLVEDTGCHAVSINAHPPVLEQSIDPAGWRRLRLAHDVTTDAISIVDHEGVPVKVLALGTQLPELFPYPVRLATWLCSSGRVVIDRAPERSHLRPAATVACPRLRVGQVILSRRRWYPGDDFPGRGDSPDDIHFLLALTRWRAHHDVPPEVMLKSVLDGPTPWETMTDAQSRARFFEVRRQAKPQYVDLASALMTRVLPRLMERRPEGFIEEALPGLAAGGHAQEWMVEMARAGGQERFDWRPRNLKTRP